MPEYRGDGRFVQPLDETMQPGDVYWRECLCCGNDGGRGGSCRPRVAPAPIPGTAIWKIRDSQTLLGYYKSLCNSSAE
jgi:hypothetical protein